MKAVVAAFNQEKALVGAFSMILQLHRLIFTALPWTHRAALTSGNKGEPRTLNLTSRQKNYYTSTCGHGADTQHSFIFQLAMLHGISPFFPEILRFVGIVTVALAQELTTKFCEIFTILSTSTS